MTAEEMQDKVPSNDGAFNYTFWLREIAIQLAELNETLSRSMNQSDPSPIHVTSLDR